MHVGVSCCILLHGSIYMQPLQITQLISEIISVLVSLLISVTVQFYWKCKEKVECTLVGSASRHGHSLPPGKTQYPLYRGADKSLARPGRKQANVFVRME